MPETATATGRVQPRPALERRLDAALTYRLTTLVAATGYGKSTLLSRWVAAVGGVGYRLEPADRDVARLAGSVASALRSRLPGLSPEVLTGAGGLRGPQAYTQLLSTAGALGAALAQAMAEHQQRDLVLALDDVDLIADSPGAVRFLETLVRAAPHRLHVVTASREPLPFAVSRLRQDRELLELDANDLALSITETAQWLRERLGEPGARFAARLHGAYAGWPVAVRAAIEHLATTDPRQWERRNPVPLPVTASLERLLGDAFQALPPATRRLLRAATVLPILDGQLATLLGATPESLATVSSRGLFLESGPDGYRLTETARQTLAREVDRAEAREAAALAAQWYASQGRPDHGLRAAVAADDPELTASLLTTHGRRLSDRPAELLDAVDRLPEPVRRRPDLRRLAGVACHNLGDWDRARDLLTAASGDAAFDAAVAWRLGLIDHLRGDFDTALSTYRRGSEHGRPQVEAAVCAAMAAAVLFMRGERPGCAAFADRALRQATALGDDRSLAAAHMAQAMLAALDGDRRADDAHLRRALEYAERSGDVMQQIRIRTNRASFLLEEGAYLEALAEVETARRLANLTGYGLLAAMTQSNRAEALLRLGRLEEAATDAAEAVARWEALGSRLGYGLNRLAQIQALRGDVRGAVATYRKVVAHAEPTDLQSLGVALAGLAELVCQDDPQQAAELIKRALDTTEPTTEIRVRLAAVRVALAGGRADEAAAMLDAVAALAAERGDRAGRAATVTLRAQVESDPGLAEQAVRQWSQVGEPVEQARAELILVRLRRPDQAAAVANEIRTRMREMGCRALDDEIDAVHAAADAGKAAGVIIETLGTFRVVRDGSPVPRAAWQSRKARDLLKILVTRYGRPVGREQLVETLWGEPGGADPAVGLKRLNVMVSTLRGVLDPDHTYPAGHYVVSEDGTLRLDLAHVDIDVARLLTLVDSASRLDRAGRHAEALRHWRAAEAAYTGGFCEEDPYADWAVALREQARLAYVEAARKVAEAESAAGRHAQAGRYWLRLLEHEPYDEHAHLGLVRALDSDARRMDARRHYHRYTELMAELGVEPTPYPTGVPDALTGRA